MSESPLIGTLPKKSKTATVATARNLVIGAVGGIAIYFLWHTHTLLQHIASSTPAFSHHNSAKNRQGFSLFSPTSYFSSSSSSGPSTCQPCLLDPSDPLCRYGIDSVRMSRAYEGSGTRVRKVLEKALRGEEVSIAILGASVTAGHGLDGLPKWQDRFMEDFIKLFPKTKKYEGIAPGVGSMFFGMCWASMVPRNLDMYILETDINNEPYMSTLWDDDYLHRSLLDQENSPAVVRVSVFGLAFEEMVRGRMSTLVTSQFFDVPVISIVNFLLPHVIAKPELVPDFMYHDMRHINFRAHEALGDMLALYMREMTCETKRRLDSPPMSIDPKWPQESSLGLIPRLRLNQQYMEGYAVPAIRPTCSIVGSDFSGLEPVASKTTGTWKIERWHDKIAWQSSEVGARIVLPFVGVEVGIFHWVTDGLHNTIQPGRARCWVDEDEASAIVVDGWWTERQSSAEWVDVAGGLEPGEHELSCEIISESSTDAHDFRIVGVIAQGMVV